MGAINQGRRHTQATKRLLSRKRKQYLRDNPDKHPWKKASKFISLPCEKLKIALREAGLLFVAEFTPDGNFHYSIDVAFPEKKIGLEVNGNQHYDSNGGLLPYYQKRHDLLQEAGWTIYEIPCRKCFSAEVVKRLVAAVVNSPAIANFDYLNYVPGKKEKIPTDFCKDCGRGLLYGGKRCWTCFVAAEGNRPGKPTCEELRKMVWEAPLVHVAKKLKVSDVAIKKWCKRYGIETPPHGYWIKRGLLVSGTALRTELEYFTMTELAKKYGCGLEALRRRCRESNVEIPQRNGQWYLRRDRLTQEAQ